MSAENVTIRERILLHLSRFPGIGPEEIYNIPFDLTQDGIASVVGISRAHASLELKKLKETHKVDYWLAHIKGSNSKRMVYRLLPDGISEATTLREELTSSGTSVDSLLDMKRCDPVIMWDNLSPEDKETFGVACVFRVPIPRKELPNTNTGVIPTDYYGFIQISENVRNKYLSIVDPEKIKVWHSRASDWWMDNGDDQERLYHLAKAGRFNDACKLMIKDSSDFLEDPNDDLFNIIKGIEPPEKYEGSFYSLRARLALDCKDIRDALACADKLDKRGTSEPALIRAEAKLIAGDPQSAFEDTSELFEEKESPRAAMIAAEALYSMGKYDEANSFLSKAYAVMSENGDASYLKEHMLLKAGIAYKRGKDDETLSYLNKALTSCRTDSSKSKIKSMIANVKEKKKDILFF